MDSVDSKKTTSENLIAEKNDVKNIAKKKSEKRKTQNDSTDSVFVDQNQKKKNKKLIKTPKKLKKFIREKSSKSKTQKSGNIDAIEDDVFIPEKQEKKRNTLKLKSFRKKKSKKDKEEVIELVAQTIEIPKSDPKDISNVKPDDENIVQINKEEFKGKLEQSKAAAAERGDNINVVTRDIRDSVSTTNAERTEEAPTPKQLSSESSLRKSVVESEHEEKLESPNAEKKKRNTLIFKSFRKKKWKDKKKSEVKSPESQKTSSRVEENAENTFLFDGDRKKQKVEKARAKAKAKREQKNEAFKKPWHTLTLPRENTVKQENEKKKQLTLQRYQESKTLPSPMNHDESNEAALPSPIDNKRNTNVLKSFRLKKSKKKTVKEEENLIPPQPMVIQVESVAMKQIPKKSEKEDNENVFMFEAEEDKVKMKNTFTTMSTSDNKSPSTSSLTSEKKISKKKLKKQNLQRQEEFKKQKQEEARKDSEGNKDQLESLIVTVKETEAVMKNNLELIIEREENLDELFIATKNLETSSVKFVKRSKKVRRKQCCMNISPCCWPCYKKLCCVNISH